MKCPNCNFDLSRFGGPAHNTGCVLGAMLSVLEDRGHELDAAKVAEIDIDAFWDRFGGPGADWLAEQMDSTPYPEVNA